MDKVLVLDDFLDVALLGYLEEKIKSPLWEFGHKSGPETSYPMWYQKVYHEGDDGSCDAEWFAIANKFCRSVNDYYGVHGVPYRIMLSGNTFGQEGDRHRDSQTEGFYTGVIHLNPEIKSHWGGETVIYTDPITTVEYKYNRLVMFPSEIPHIGRAPIRQSGQLRTILSLMSREDV